MSTKEYKPDAAEADRLLNDPVFKWALEQIRQGILANLESTPVRDREGREYLCLMLKVAKGLRDQITHVVRQGKLKDLSAKKTDRNFLGDLINVNRND